MNPYSIDRQMTLDTKSARLGWVPLILYCVNLINNILRGTPADSLWMCHLANLLLGIGLLARRPVLIRPAILWLLIGSVLWMRYVWLTADFRWIQCLTHMGGLFVGLSVAKCVRFDRFAWFHASIFALAAQLLCRYTTPPSLNINIAHNTANGVEYLTGMSATPSSVALETGVVLWLVNRFLSKRYPADNQQ